MLAYLERLRINSRVKGCKWANHEFSENMA